MKKYQIISQEKIDEINVTLVHLQHKKTGAEIIHCKNDDPENVFSILCKTYPSDDKGTAHILEHCVLCGSKKFPIKDPFFSMIRRSLNTFMNAMTAKVWTCYPAATMNEKDFYHLLDVYTDAVFYPLLTKESFLQEGHRLELHEKNGKEELEVKGIVYNEMKGVFSNPSSIFFRTLFQKLCPHHTYGFDSGGVPESITDLSYEEFLAFHKKYYDPAKAIFFFYGDLPTEKHLSFLEEKVFSQTKIQPQIEKISLIDRFVKPRREEALYPSSHENGPCYVSLSWMTFEVMQIDELLTLYLLDYLLMGHDGSLLKKQFLESSLCSDAYSFIDPEMREVPFGMIFEGVSQENVEKIEPIILEFFVAFSQKNLSKERLEEAFHQLEFSRKEIDSGSTPFGLELFFRSVIPYVQGARLEDGLKIHRHLKQLKKNLEKEDFLDHFLQKHLLQNPHRLTFIMRPSSHLAREKEQEHRKTLEETLQKLTEKEKEKILQQQKKLASYQERLDQTSCLPLLSLDDIQKHATYFPLEKIQNHNIRYFHHQVFTNDIAYVDVIMDIPQIEEEDLLFLKLFTDLMPDLGTKERSYEKNLAFIHRYTGGIHANLALNVQKTDVGICYPTFSLGGKVLTRNAPQFFQLLADMILDMNLQDPRRIKDLILQMHTEMNLSAASSAFRFSLYESGSSFSPWAFINNYWNGRPYDLFIHDLAKNIDTMMEVIIENLEKIRKILFHMNSPHVVLSCSGEQMEKFQTKDFYGLSKLSTLTAPFQPWIDLPQPQRGKNSIIGLDTRIFSNSLSFESVTLRHPLSPSVKLITYLIEHLYLHKMIREKGGAYGVSTRYNILTGLFQMASYRDPNCISTFQAFQKSLDRILQGHFSDEDLFEARLSYFQDVDRKVPVSGRATITYFQKKVGLTKAVREEFRKGIFNATKATMIEAATMLQKNMERAIMVSYAPSNMAENLLPQLEKEMHSSFTFSSFETRLATYSP